MTMTNTMCNRSDLRRLVNSSAFPQHVKDLLPNSLMKLLHSSSVQPSRSTSAAPSLPSRKKHEKKLDSDVYSAFQRHLCLSGNRSQTVPAVQIVPSHTIDGVQFTTFVESRSLSMVYYFPQPDRTSTAIPGLIRTIFWHSKAGQAGNTGHECLMAISPYDPLDLNLFSRWKGARFGIYSSEASLTTVHIVYSTQVLCHAAQVPWEDPRYKACVMRAQDRVRCYGHLILLMFFMRLLSLTARAIERLILAFKRHLLYFI